MQLATPNISGSFLIAGVKPNTGVTGAAGKTGFASLKKGLFLTSEIMNFAGPRGVPLTHKLGWGCRATFLLEERGAKNLLRMPSHLVLEEGF
jgi:hypothetical protein